MSGFIRAASGHARVLDPLALGKTNELLFPCLGVGNLCNDGNEALQAFGATAGINLHTQVTSPW